MLRLLLLATGLFVSAIGVVLLIRPDSYIALYVLSYDPGMTFAARRLAPAIIGLGGVLLLARTLPKGRFLSGLCLICGCAFLGVAATGVHAWLTDLAKPAILVAAGIEGTIAAAFLTAAAQMRTD
ncbi:hypothetical protein ACG74X_17710 [Marivita sp. S0852]|uniref:hypothetical protein n=1 Tax=Marivita sp. S0852 TaxID=3373893 RepID=UPI003982C78F